MIGLTTVTNAEPKVSHIGISHQNNPCTNKVVLLTARVKVAGTSGCTTNATVLFDTGSDRTYVSSSLVRKVKPEWVDAQPMAYAAFGTGKASKVELTAFLLPESNEIV